jgi:tellurite resistance protein
VPDEPIVAFPDVDAERLLAALAAAVTGDEPRAVRLRTSASQCVVDEPSDVAAARWFQSLVELAYLVASADGFSPRERASLASLIERATGRTVDHELLERHLAALEEQTDVFGRHQRLARAAADVSDQPSVDDALAFAALVAMADGTMTAAEHEALLELAGHLHIEPVQVEALIGVLVEDVKGRLS